MTMKGTNNIEHGFQNDGQHQANIHVDICCISRAQLTIVHIVSTLVPEKSVQYVAQFLASADLNCACARFCYSVSPWVTFQKF